jgi:hypothetical protein
MGEHRRKADGRQSVHDGVQAGDGPADRGGREDPMFLQWVPMLRFIGVCHWPALPSSRPPRQTASSCGSRSVRKGGARAGALESRRDTLGRFGRGDDRHNLEIDQITGTPPSTR